MRGKIPNVYKVINIFEIIWETITLSKKNIAYLALGLGIAGCSEITPSKISYPIKKTENNLKKLLKKKVNR